MHDKCVTDLDQLADKLSVSVIGANVRLTSYAQWVIEKWWRPRSQGQALRAMEV